MDVLEGPLMGRPAKYWRLLWLTPRHFIGAGWKWICFAQGTKLLQECFYFPLLSDNWGSLLGGINYRALWKIGPVKDGRAPQSLGQGSAKWACPCGPSGKRSPGCLHQKLPFRVFKQFIGVIQSQSQVQETYSTFLNLGNRQPLTTSSPVHPSLRWPSSGVF